jgi:hypothetical protein
MTSRIDPRPVHRMLTVAVALTALLALLPMASAHAQSSSLRSRTVERTGRCGSSNAHWDLKTKRVAPGKIYVEFEVDSIPRGAHWQLFVSQNGRRIAAVDRTAHTSKGVQVSRVTNNRHGRDRIRAAGVNPRTGTSCAGHLRY